MSREPIIRLPNPLYFTLDELCQRWGCHSDRVLQYFDAGLLVPSVLVAKHRLPLSAHEGVAPNVVLVLDEYTGLVWTHEDGDAVAYICGDFTALAPSGEGWRTLALSLPEPVPIKRRDLVVLDAVREEIENPSRPRCNRGNTTAPNRLPRTY